MGEILHTLATIMPLTLPALTRKTAEQMRHAPVFSIYHHWAVLKASGATVRDYLQGQITQDIGKLSSNHAIHTALLTPQGKPVSELYIFEGSDDELVLLTPASKAVAAVARLRQFALGHDLRIGIVESLSICSVQGENSSDILHDFAIPEPNTTWLATSHSESDESFAVVMAESPRALWIISSREKIDAALCGKCMLKEGEAEALRIMHGFIEFGREWSEKVHPLNANLTEFHGISFDKGCYVGQEVSARMNWRGGIKKKLYRISISEAPETLPCPVLSSTKIGELISAAIDHTGCCFGIAMLPIETAELATPLALENGAEVEALEPCRAR